MRIFTNKANGKGHLKIVQITIPDPLFGTIHRDIDVKIELLNPNEQDQKILDEIVIPNIVRKFKNEDSST